jgi:hypothetical protein
MQSRLETGVHPFWNFPAPTFLWNKLLESLEEYRVNPKDLHQFHLNDCRGFSGAKRLKSCVLVLPFQFNDVYNRRGMLEFLRILVWFYTSFRIGLLF